MLMQASKLKTVLKLKMYYLIMVTGKFFLRFYAG